MINIKNQFKGNSRRLAGYDYSQPGKYFITICAYNHNCIFGIVDNNKTFLNDYGKLVKKYWLEIPHHFKNVELDEFIIMPNHLHGIIIITENNDKSDKIDHRRYSERKSSTLSTIVGSFKGVVTKKVNSFKNKNNSIWQSNYYDRIIRNQTELNLIREYIKQNPINWEKNT